MNGTHMKVLIGIVVLLAGLTFFVSSGSDSSSSTSSTTTLLATIPGEQIAKILLEKGDESVELLKTDGTWTVPAAGGYQADRNKVRSLLLKLLDMSSSQALPTSEEGKKKLGLTDEAVKEGSGRIMLYDAEDKELGGLLLGQRRMDAGGASAPAAAAGQYVRRLNDDQVYLIGLPMTLSLSSANWLDTELVNVREASVRSVTQFELKEEERSKVFQLARTLGDDGMRGELELVQAPADGEEAQESILSQVRAALENAKFVNVKRADELEQPLEYDKETVFELRSGLVYRVSTAKQGEKTFAAIAVSFDPQLAEELTKEFERRQELQASADKEEAETAQHDSAEENTEEAETAKAEVDQADSKSPDPEDDEAAEAGDEQEEEKLTLSSEEEAQTLMKRFEPWVFELPDYQAAKYRYSRSDLLTSSDNAKLDEEAPVMGSGAPPEV